IALAWRACDKRNDRYLSAFALSGFFLLGSVLVLAGAISPWLFSKMEPLVTRHILPWYLFFCAVIVCAVFRLLRHAPARIARFSPLIVVAVVALPLAVAQEQQSLLQVKVADAEIDFLRARMADWIGKQGWVNDRLLFIVRPVEVRPADL